MRIALNYLKLKDDFNRLELLHWGHFCFIFLAFTLECLYGSGLINWIFSSIVLLCFYRLFFITKKELFYSFWSFSLFLSIYLIYNIIFGSYPISEIKLLYFISLVMLLVEAYILSSPIYYPRVSWWEYDFRYRTDLKVNLLREDNNTEARVTDLRRDAGCIASFEEFKIGEILEITSNKYFKETLKIEVISKRIYSLGRPFSYGVKFELENDIKKSSYQNLLNIWKNESLQRKEKKFKRSEK